ncbi:hypothetical protein EDD21DRAFT_125096 [Dissophora ornata]|nr:hypothetical protein EDD21DRAFT_125096 [Dissophora ornata]
MTRMRTWRKAIAPLLRRVAVESRVLPIARQGEEDGQGQDGLGAQSLHGKGLGYYASLVCDRVEARLVTTYNDLVQDLAGGDRVDGAPAQEQTGQGNIGRRVYDALNILEALGIIS